MNDDVTKNNLASEDSFTESRKIMLNIVVERLKKVTRGELSAVYLYSMPPEFFYAARSEGTGISISTAASR